MLCMMRNLEIERVTLAAMGLGIARYGGDTYTSDVQEVIVGLLVFDGTAG